jgi:hypothetical protein
MPNHHKTTQLQTRELERSIISDEGFVPYDLPLQYKFRFLCLLRGCSFSYGPHIHNIIPYKISP